MTCLAQSPGRLVLDRIILPLSIFPAPMEFTEAESNMNDLVSEYQQCRAVDGSMIRRSG